MYVLIRLLVAVCLVPVSSRSLSQPCPVWRWRAGRKVWEMGSEALGTGATEICLSPSLAIVWMGCSQPELCKPHTGHTGGKWSIQRRMVTLGDEKVKTRYSVFYVWQDSEFLIDQKKLYTLTLSKSNMYLTT